MSTVEPVLVEPVRFQIGCGDHHDTMFEQGREQPAQDHRIGNIGDLKLVETKKRGALRDLRGNRCNRIFLLLAPVMNPPVHILHELVKMDPRLRLDARQIEEQVHEHRLAAPHPAPEV